MWKMKSQLNQPRNFGNLLVYLTLVANCYLGIACNSRTGDPSSIPSLNKKQLPGLTWPDSDISTEKLIETQMKTLEDYNKQVKIIKGAIGAAGSVVPYKAISVPLKGVNDLLLVLESTTKLERKLTDNKISTEILKLTVVELEKEVEAIGRRLAKANDVNLDRRYREDEILPAIGAAEKLFSLFKNPKYYFDRNRMVSFPYLATFATVFGFVGRYASELRPDYSGTFERYFAEMRPLLKKYATDAWIQRVLKVHRTEDDDCTYLRYSFHPYGASKCALHSRDFNSEVGSPPQKDQGCTLNYFITPFARRYLNDEVKQYPFAALDAFNVDPSIQNSDNFVCRVNISGNIFPGKSNGMECWYTNGNVEDRKWPDFELLAHTWSWRESKQLKWKAGREDGSIPSNAIPVGNLGSEPLYVGRCLVGQRTKFLATGYVKQGTTYATYGGKVYSCTGSESQILVCE